ncbi:MAG: hypothetical protein QXR48_03235 [Candidatus Woesearchaeota archaeon]
MIEYKILLLNLVRSEARMHYFKESGPACALKKEMELYERYKSML